jgi:universal stress protein E
MKTKRTKLFVIIDPKSEHQVALVKALLIARLGDCHIHAFLCVYNDLDEHDEASSRKALKQKTLQDGKDWLKELMEPCEVCNVPFSTEVIWNSKWYKAALRSVEKSGCDLVIKSSFHHSKARRFFSNTSDHTLMRYCACPILFTHQSQEWQSDIILACVDLESGDPQHAKLNNSIIRNARALKDVIGMDLHIASIYEEAIDESRLPVAHNKNSSLAEELAQLYGVEKGSVFLRKGATVESLNQICEEIDPSILIIGSIARTGVSGKLIGNTAEKLLDVVEADLLTVN